MNAVTATENTLLEKIESNPQDIASYEDLVNFYQKQNQVEAARKYAEQCVEQHPQSARAFNLLGFIQRQQGLVNEAKISFNTALSLEPGSCSTYYLISSVHKFQKDELLLEEMIKKQQSFDLSTLEKIHLNFALAKAFDDIDNYVFASKHLLIANNNKKSLLDYNIEKDLLVFEIIKQNYQDFLGELSIEPGNTNQKPVFILGMPRSGTSLLERVLSSHSELYAGGELYYIAELSSSGTKKFPHNCSDLSEADLFTMRSEYLEKIEALSPDHKFITDKMPANFMFLGLIAKIFPDAKIIYCKRDAIDTCISNFKQLFARGQKYSYDLKDLANYYKAHDELMQFWIQEFPEQIITLEYENLVSDFENAIKKLLAELDLEWQDACLEFYKQKGTANTASAVQVKQDIHQNSRAYKEKYPGLAQILGEELGLS